MSDLLDSIPISVSLLIWDLEQLIYLFIYLETQFPCEKVEIIMLMHKEK